MSQYVFKIIYKFDAEDDPAARKRALKLVKDDWPKDVGIRVVRHGTSRNILEEVKTSECDGAEPSCFGCPHLGKHEFGNNCAVVCRVSGKGCVLCERN